MATYLPPTIVNSVSSQISNAWSLVTTAYDRGVQALNTLGSQKYDTSWDSVEVEDIEPPAIVTTIPELPELDEVPEFEVQFGGTPVSVDSGYVYVPYVPPYVETNYNFSIPGAPVVTWPSFAKNAPSVSDIQMPSSPSFNIPEVPALANVTIPAPPTYSVPEFTATEPMDSLQIPALSFAWSESAYSSGLKTKLGDLLYDNLVAGGTGLNEATEQAIYDRAKSRMEDEEQALLDAVNNGMAARGFPLPLGAYAAQVLSAENKILRSRGDLNNDILVNQSKLAQENTHFIIQEAAKLETVLLSYHGEVQNRAMQAAEFVVTTAIQQYGLRVEGYKAKLSSYATMAQVYQTRIQGEVAKAEFYRAQIDGVQASVAVQGALVDAYRAQIAGIAALVDVYKAQMEGASIRAGIDKTRLDGFLAEVQAYSARVMAEAAKYEGYKAQIAGEATKADMRKVDVEAYAAQVSGLKTKVDMQAVDHQIRLEKTKAQVDVFNGYVQKYNADVQAALGEAEIVAKRDGVKLDTYKAQGGMYTAEINALIQVYMGQIEEVKNKTSLAIRESEVTMQALLSKYQLTAENLKAIAQVTGQMASAAAASVNASLSASHSDSNSAANQATYSTTESTSTSQSYSVVEETIHQISSSE